MNINPALAGANHDLNASLAHRNQWSSFANPFQTSMLSVDGRIFKKQLERNGNLGVGLTLLNDRAGRDGVVTNTVTLSAAYHVLVADNHTIGAGIYAGWGQRSLNSSESTWGNQYVGGAFNQAAPTGEDIGSASFSAIDLGAGLLYTYGFNSRQRPESDIKLNVGLSVYHVNRPNYSFLNTSNESQFIRITGFVNAEIPTSAKDVSLLPGIYYHNQGPANHLLMGTYAKFKIGSSSLHTGFKKSSSFSAGLFYRFKDAVVAKAMLEWSSFNVGFAYDFNVSSLTSVSRSLGGFEMFLSFSIEDMKKTSFSPRFGR